MQSDWFEVNERRVHLTGTVCWVLPNHEIHLGLHVFRASYHYTSFSPPSSDWILGEGRLGNYFQRPREQTKQTWGLWVSSRFNVRLQRSTNQWLSCTLWPSSFPTFLVWKALKVLTSCFDLAGLEVPDVLYCTSSSQVNTGKRSFMRQHHQSF